MTPDVGDRPAMLEHWKFALHVRIKAIDESNGEYMVLTPDQREKMKVNTSALQRFRQQTGYTGSSAFIGDVLDWIEQQQLQS
jgi:hypothetical protein